MQYFNFNVDKIQILDKLHDKIEILGTGISVSVRNLQLSAPCTLFSRQKEYRERKGGIEKGSEEKTEYKAEMG